MASRLPKKLEGKLPGRPKRKVPRKFLPRRVASKHWFYDMSLTARKAYLKAHPNSAYGKGGAK